MRSHTSYSLHGLPDSEREAVEKIIRRNSDIVGGLDSIAEAAEVDRLFCEFRFFYQGNFTVCIVTISGPGKPSAYVIGVSKCNTSDKFNNDRGHLIALSRAVHRLADFSEE